MQTSRAGYSNRHTPTMELLRPTTRSRSASQPPRPLAEIEDAVFETVVPKIELADCDYGAPEGLFVPHVTRDGHVSHGYRQATVDPFSNGGRLDLFSGKSLPVAAMEATHSPMAGPAFLTGVVAVAAAFFWMAGGHTFMPGPDVTLMTATVPVEKIMPVVSASPFQDGSSVQFEMVRPAKDIVLSGATPSEGVAEKTTARPARIERAGSILMIRSGS